MDSLGFLFCEEALSGIRVLLPWFSTAEEYDGGHDVSCPYMNDGSRKTDDDGRARGARTAACGRIAARTDYSAICGFVCRGAWTTCFAGACFAISGFAGVVTAGGAFGGDCEGAGNHLRGTAACGESEAAADAAKRCGGVSAEIPGGVDTAAEMERGRRAGFSNGLADV